MLPFQWCWRWQLWGRVFLASAEPYARSGKAMINKSLTIGNGLPTLRVKPGQYPLTQQPIPFRGSTKPRRAARFSQLGREGHNLLRHARRYSNQRGDHDDRCIRHSISNSFCRCGAEHIAARRVSASENPLPIVSTGTETIGEWTQVAQQQH